MITLKYQQYFFVNLIKFFILIIPIVIGGLFCDYPYSPETQLPPSTGNRSLDPTAALIEINPKRQICNPSASQDPVNFKGCMLFLNLGGIIDVKLPANYNWADEYTKIADQPHDRLTIVDTSNTVRWFIMKPSIISESVFQDPEWSTDPDYIACLGDADDNSSGYIVRISDKELLQFNKSKLLATSTPHVWISHNPKHKSLDPSVSPSLFKDNPSWNVTTGMIDKASINKYFGTDSVKIAFSIKERSVDLSIFFIDYSQTKPELVKLQRPEGRNGYQCESPLISPDGNWVVFNCKNGILDCESYLQKLSADSKPVLLHKGMSSDPHWWKDNLSNSYILYCTKTGPIETPLDMKLSDGSIGSTLIRRFDVSTNLQWLSLMDEVSVLSRLPFQGGLTSDGHYLVTGYQFGYILKLN